MHARADRGRRGNRRRLDLRLLSAIPAAVALAVVVVSGTALADGPLDVLSDAPQPVATVTQPVTQVVDQVTGPWPAPPPATPVKPVATPATTVTAPVTQAAKDVTEAAEPVTQTAKQVTEAAEPVTQTATKVAEAAAPVTQAAKKVAAPVTPATKEVTTSVAPVTNAARKVTSGVAQPATQAVRKVTTSTKPVTTTARQVVAATVGHVANAKPAVKTITQNTRTVVTTGGTASRRNAQGSSSSSSPAAAVKHTVAAVGASARPRVVAKAHGARAAAQPVSGGARARDAGAGVSAGSHRATLEPAEQLRRVPVANTALPRAVSAAQAPTGDGGSSDGVPGSAIGLVALLGALGFGAVRSGQIAPGLAALYGTGGFRPATQALFTFAWSGRCGPLGESDALSANAAAVPTAQAPGTAGADGGRAAVKGVLSTATSSRAHHAESWPSDLALVVHPSRGGSGPSAAIAGLLLAASAAVGALLGRFTSGGRSRASDNA